MRKEDKLILLAELLSCDVSSFVKEKKDEFLKSPVLLEIEELLIKEKDNESPKYLSLKEEYKKIIETNIDSYETYFNTLGKAHNILYTFKSKKYINPLFAFKDDEDYMLKSIKIYFDGKDRTLGDIVMSEDYSSDFKIDCIKSHVISWNKEVKESFVYPLEALITYPKNLQTRNKIPWVKRIYGLFLLAINLVWVIGLFINEGFVYNILRGNYVREYFAIPFICLYYVTFLADFFYLFSILRRYKYVKKYLEGRELFFEDTYQIIQKLDAASEKLYKDILSCIVSKSEVTGSVKKYSKLGNEFRTFLYMKKINEKTSLREDLLFTYEVIFVQIIVIIIVYLIACVLLISGGFLLWFQYD